jgi:predicted dehydrogenase
MTSSILKAGLVGCGRIGAFTNPSLLGVLPPGYIPLSHAEAIQAVPGLVLAAMCDVNAENLDRARVVYKNCKYYSDFSRMILEAQLDVLSIATRTPGRCDIIQAAVNSGVRGLHIEKPISNNMRDCKKALRAIESKRVFFTYGATRRFMDVYRKAKEILDSGEIGALVQIIIQNGRTLLLWDHPHGIDLMLFFSGASDIEYTQGNCAITPASVGNPLTLDDDPIVESGLVKFTNGVTGLISAGSGNNIILCGSRGNLTIAADGSWIQIEKKANGNSPYFIESSKLVFSPAMSGTQRAFHELHLAVTEGRLTGTSTKDVEINQRILLSLAQSSVWGGERLNPNELDDDFTVTGKFNGKYA